ncbi:MAG TPA: ZIP family metal transporter [Candidatus Limnocylindria bacterium]|nr:ZIP family metal transporter [Candidatus Limnocylindria bacterium]
MSDQLLLVTAIAVAAGAAPLLGTGLGLVHRPSTLLMSIVLGFAAGAIIGTAVFEMVPRSIELAPAAVAIGAFVTGYLAFYAFDLLLHRGQTAGEHAEQRQHVSAYRRWHRPVGTETTVLAGGTLIEEVIEGMTIGASASLDPALAGIVALAIALDSFGEGASIVELMREERGRGKAWRRALPWTGAMGVAMAVSTVAGFLFLRDVPDVVIGGLLAFGAGGFMYLTITKLIPEGEARHYEQSAALAAGAGLVVVMVLQLVLLSG